MRRVKKTIKIMKNSMRIIKAILCMPIRYISITNFQIKKTVAMKAEDSSAIPGIPDGDKSGKICFSFNDVGEIVKYESSDRYKGIDRTFQQLDAIEYRSNYKKIDDIEVPMKFTIVRVLQNGTHEEFW